MNATQSHVGMPGRMPGMNATQSVPGINLTQSVGMSLVGMFGMNTTHSPSRGGMNTTQSHCTEACGICIEIAGKNRTGPSLCFQDYYLAPLFVAIVVTLLAKRVKVLSELPLAEPPRQYWTSKDFCLVVVLAVHSVYGLLMVEGGDSAEDSTTVYYGTMVVTWGASIAIMMAEGFRKQPRGAELKIIYLFNTLFQLFRFRIALLHMAFMKSDDTGTTSDSRAWADSFAFVVGCFVAIASLLEPTGVSGVHSQRKKVSFNRTCIRALTFETFVRRVSYEEEDTLLRQM
jgi:hypothetical protein